MSAEETTAIPNFFSEISPLFPEVTEDGKIDTVQFLEASKAFIKIYDQLGRAFALVKSDMNGNVEKLYTTYNKNPEKYKYLNDMIEEEKNDPTIFAVDALLWLRRALEFTYVFVRGIIDEFEAGNPTEKLDHLANIAYTQTLKPYHNWAAQNLFKIVAKACPYRSSLVKSLFMGKEEGSQRLLLEDASRYLQKLLPSLNVIKKMCEEWSLEEMKKV
ncbi:glycolipid transfer protein [Oratosquilla oratoria]|uniref:glycolipid transfer protein n=1 Tax=Oratosquilla oratoria TaxID=337810 RepID=UPI003F75ADD9